MKKARQFCRNREQLQSWVVWNEPEMEQQGERLHHSRMHGILQAPFEVCLRVTVLNVPRFLLTPQKNNVIIPTNQKGVASKAKSPFRQYMPGFVIGEDSN